MSKISLACTAAALLVLISNISPAQAQSNSIYSCYNNVNGQMRRVTSPAECKNGETALAWNIQGQKGDKGDKGDTGEKGETGSQGQNGQDGASGLSTVYNASETPISGSGELPVTDLFAAPPILRKLDLPAGKYLIAAKILVSQNSSTPFFATATCSLGTGPNISFFGPDLLDVGTYGAYPSSGSIGLSGNIVLGTVFETSVPKSVELRCSRTSEAVMNWSFVRLTAIKVNEVITQ